MNDEWKNHCWIDARSVVRFAWNSCCNWFVSTWGVYQIQYWNAQNAEKLTLWFCSFVWIPWIPLLKCEGKRFCLRVDCGVEEVHRFKISFIATGWCHYSKYWLVHNNRWMRVYLTKFHIKYLRCQAMAILLVSYTCSMYVLIKCWNNVAENSARYILDKFYSQILEIFQRKCYINGSAHKFQSKTKAIV